MGYTTQECYCHVHVFLSLNGLSELDELPLEVKSDVKCAPVGCCPSTSSFNASRAEVSRRSDCAPRNARARVGLREPLGPLLPSAGKDTRGCLGKELLHITWQLEVDCLQSRAPVLPARCSRWCFLLCEGHPFSIVWSPTRLNAA